MWEDLVVYKPLEKQELRVAKKEIEKLISDGLIPYGFKKYGKKLIRQSEDLFHIIHLDSRGSWMGSSKYLKTEIAIISVFDTEVIIENHEPISGLYIENIIPNIKNYYQITQEYKLFADFILRNLKEYILPFFDNYPNSKEVLAKEIKQRQNQNLILWSELNNHIANKSLNIIKARIELLKRNNYLDPLEFWTNIEKDVENSNWKRIDEILNTRRKEVYKKLKITTTSS